MTGSPTSTRDSAISFFAGVFRASAVPTVIIAPDSTVLFWNTAMERLFGWSAEEAVGRLLPIVPPQQWGEHVQLRRRTQAGEGYSQQRVTRRDKQGQRVEVTLSTWPIRDANGSVIAMVGIHADVGADELRFERALANQQLEEIERLYVTAPIGLGFIDTDLRFVRVNARLAQIDGLSAEAHVGKRLADVVPEVAASLEDIYLEVIARGIPLRERELRAATPALPGVPRDWQVSAYPLKHPDGTVLGITIAVSDITERKRWSEELKRQEELLRLVIDGLPGMVLYVDRHYRYRFANRAAGEWFQRSPSDFEGRKATEVLGETTFEDIRGQVDCALAGEEVLAEFHHRYPDRERDVRAHYVPDRAADGEVRGMVSFVEDVTERKKNEQRLRQVQKLESLGIMAGGVAHDFNNLLTSILGNASFVLDTLEPGNRSRAMLQDVVTASERAAQLTRQMLTYAGKDQSRLQPVDVAAAAREVVPLLSASIPKMVRLSLELEDGVPLVDADTAQLQQVMMNLVINAAESIPERTPGEVRVGVSRQRLKPEDYRDAVMPIEDSDREYVSFSVTDNGSGMDPATQAHIFDPFFSTKFAGRGLGLAAVLGIVRMHDGTLTVRTAPEKGSVFTVFLPASDAARPA